MHCIDTNLFINYFISINVFCCVKIATLQLKISDLIRIRCCSTALMQANIMSAKEVLRLHLILLSIKENTFVDSQVSVVRKNRNIVVFFVLRACLLENRRIDINSFFVIFRRE